MRVRTLAAVAALALGTVIGGGAANATTQVFGFTVDGCNCMGSGVTSLGTVTVSDTGGMLDFMVNLINGAEFNGANSGAHNAFVFNLNTGATDVSGLQYVTTGAHAITAGFTGQPIPGSYNEPPPGSTNWSDAVDYTGGAGQGNAGTTLDFRLTDTLNNLSLSMLTSPGLGGPSGSAVAVMFGADVFSNGNTGSIFTPTGPSPGVPEPATWGLMITGVFCVGAAMRRQRRYAFTSA